MSVEFTVIVMMALRRRIYRLCFFDDGKSVEVHFARVRKGEMDGLRGRGRLIYLHQR